MKIKSNKNKIFCIFCICFVFVFLNTSIVLNIDNGHQIAFSQGYIPPPISNFKSMPVQCPQIAFSGPTYKGLDGCPRPCPTANNNPNVANVYIPPECRNQAIGNQSGGIGTSNPITQCPQIAFSGPTYKGLDGCPRPCPNNTNNPNINTGQVFIPECQNRAIGNQSGGGQYSKDNPCVSAQVYTGPTYRDQEFGCPKPCPTSGNIPPGCPPQIGVIIDNQSLNTFKSK